MTTTFTSQQTSISPASTGPITLHATSEAGRLRTVILGYADNFHQVEPEIINETQKRTYFGANPPTRERLIAEMDGFRRALETFGVTVLRPAPVNGVPDQLMPRDIGVTIDETLVITRMAKASRRDEWLGLTPLLDQLPAAQVVRVPEGAVLEGGDVIVDAGVIYVGIGQRTDAAGYHFLKAQFPHYTVLPVHLKPVAAGEDVLHLDCAFVPLGRGHALIYPDGLELLPEIIRERYALIPVTRDEQAALATNVLSISPDTVVSRPQMTRVNAEMRARGYTVVQVPYDDPPKTGGAFRCSTLPLWRE
jgi:N-dimethylarginine dimethylaminohydrolase